MLQGCRHSAQVLCQSGQGRGNPMVPVTHGLPLYCSWAFGSGRQPIERLGLGSSPQTLVQVHPLAIQSLLLLLLSWAKEWPEQMGETEKVIDFFVCFCIFLSFLRDFSEQRIYHVMVKSVHSAIKEWVLPRGWPKYMPQVKKNKKWSSKLVWSFIYPCQDWKNA